MGEPAGAGGFSVAIRAHTDSILGPCSAPAGRQAAKRGGQLVVRKRLDDVNGERLRGPAPVDALEDRILIQLPREPGAALALILHVRQDLRDDSIEERLWEAGHRYFETRSKMAGACCFKSSRMANMRMPSLRSSGAPWKARADCHPRGGWPPRRIQR